MARKADIRVGVSGWTYAPWRGNFYPEGLPQKRELAFAAAAFNALEINGTFYGMQTPSSFLSWAAEAPDDFLFAVKGPRFITHMKRLRDCEAPLANFYASGLPALGRTLGPVLWQLPPNFRFDAAQLEEFFRLLPRTPTEVVALARRHDQRLRAPAWLAAEHLPPLRHALEIRHDSFRDPAFIELLRRFNIALVV